MTYAITDTSYQKKRFSREELVKHMESFSLDLKISLGIWYFAPGGGRFHEAYVPGKTIAERIEMAAGMAKFGVKAIEAHYPVEVNEENYYLYERLEKETGIVLQSAYPAIFYPKEYELGSLSNPIKKYRDKASETLVNALKFVKEKKLHHAGIWPGIDGYTYSLGTLFYDMWDRFEGAVAEAMDEVPGVICAYCDRRFGIGRMGLSTSPNLKKALSEMRILHRMRVKRRCVGTASAALPNMLLIPVT